MIKVGVFDSGIGGLSVAKAIEKSLPNVKVIFRNDNKNIPYGTKTKQHLKILVLPILKTMVAEGCEVIIIACNTVTTTLITELRKELSVPLIGMEPMVKSASKITKSKIIAIFATPTTLASERYNYLKLYFAQGIKVIEPDCSDWTKMIEFNQIDHVKISKITNQVCEQKADVIVLGCTHYHWIEALIKQCASKSAIVLQPEQPVIKQLQQIILSLNSDKPL